MPVQVLTAIVSAAALISLKRKQRFRQSRLK